MTNIQIFSTTLRRATLGIARLLLGTLIFSAPGQADWVNSELSGMPVDAIVGGKTATGSTAYLCRAYHGNDLQPGWTVKGDPSCHFSYAGEELTSNNFDWWVPSWRPVLGGQYPMPGNLIPFRGENNAFRYPCRSGATPGKFGFDLGGCLYPFGGVEKHQAINGFDVLVDPDGGNVDHIAGMTPTYPMYAEQEVGPFMIVSAGVYDGAVLPLPADAIVGGTDSGGQPLYLCSADVSEALDPPFYTAGSRQPGKARADWNACDVSYGGLENFKSTFWVLIPNWVQVYIPDGDSLTCVYYQNGECTIIPHPIEVGRDTNGEALYACQVSVYPGPAIYLGKVGASFQGGCSYATNGVEHYSQYFSVLTDGLTNMAYPD